MRLGAEMTTKEIEDKMKDCTANQCASLVYTVRVMSMFICFMLLYFCFIHF